MTDVALVPERDIFHRCDAEATQNARQSTDALALLGIALVRHGRGPLLTRAERLERLAHLGALQVAYLLRHLLQRRPCERQGCAEMGVAVALHDLAGNRLRSQAKLRADILLDARWTVVCVPTAPEIFPTAMSSIAASSRARARRSSPTQTASLNPKVVGSAWIPWVRPIMSVWRYFCAAATTAPVRRSNAVRSSAPASTRRTASAVSTTS